MMEHTMNFVKSLHVHLKNSKRLSVLNSEKVNTHELEVYDSRQ